MRKTPIDPFDYASKICHAIPNGVLLTTKSGDEVDTMVIGWGFIGTFWGEPTFVAYIRTSRHTYKMLEESGEFTVNVPMDRLDSEIMRVAGFKSGRYVNKVEELGLTLVNPDVVSAPALFQCPITLECKVVYKQLLDADAIPPEAGIFYPADVTDPDEPMRSSFLHMAFYGRIVASYVVETVFRD